MGKYNSSKYRVKPLMDYVKANDDALLKVLDLVHIKNVGKPTRYWYDSDGDDECKEKQLKPTKKHLEALIEYISRKDFGDAIIKNEKRRDLCIPNKEDPNSRENTCKEAIVALNEAYDNLSASSKAWYIFEGFTNPDIFIEGEDYVIVVEAKWTESHITEHTINLSAKDGAYRNQMIRHIQGALNYTDKKVYAFYIVDEDCNYTNELKKGAFEKQLEKETIEIGDEEREKILNTFYEYTTWQKIKGSVLNFVSLTSILFLRPGVGRAHKC